MTNRLWCDSLWKRGEIAPQEHFLLFSTIFCNLILDFCIKTRTRFPLRDKRLFEITEVEITRVDCIFHLANDNQMSYPFGARGVIFTVWQILYQFAESEESSSTDYKYVLLNNFCKNITCLREEAFRQSST